MGVILGTTLKEEWNNRIIAKAGLDSNRDGLLTTLEEMRKGHFPKPNSVDYFEKVVHPSCEAYEYQ